MRSDNLMGCCTFYDADVLELLEVHKIQYLEATNDKLEPHNFMSIVFRHKSTKIVFTNTVTHLKAKAPFAEARLNQMRMLTRKVNQIVESSGSQFSIVSGDLNEGPEGKAVQLLSEHYVSAYDLAALGYTTLKHRPHGLEKSIEDYVFYHSSEPKAVSLTVS